MIYIKDEKKKYEEKDELTLGFDQPNGLRNKKRKTTMVRKSNKSLTRTGCTDLPTVKLGTVDHPVFPVDLFCNGGSLLPSPQLWYAPVQQNFRILLHSVLCINEDNTTLQHAHVRAWERVHAHTHNLQADTHTHTLKQSTHICIYPSLSLFVYICKACIAA